MYEWPPLGDLAFLIGHQLTAVRVSSWPVDLYFSKPPEVVIGLESLVRVQLADGRVIEPGHLPDAGVALIGLIGSTIISIERPSSQCIILRCDVGAITMHSTDEHYECYSIVGDGRAIYI